MFGGDKSKLALAILGKGAGPPEEDPAEVPAVDDSTLAAQDLIAAVRGKDAAGVLDAMRSIFESFQAEPDDAGAGEVEAE